MIYFVGHTYMTLSLFGVIGHDYWPVKAMYATGERTEDSLRFDPGAVQ